MNPVDAQSRLSSATTRFFDTSAMSILITKAIASWSYSCSSKERAGLSPTISHSNPPKLPGNFGLKSCQVSNLYAPDQIPSCFQAHTNLSSRSPPLGLKSFSKPLSVEIFEVLLIHIFLLAWKELHQQVCALQSELPLPQMGKLLTIFIQDSKGQ